jgi:hypothetical protein
MAVLRPCYVVYVRSEPWPGAVTPAMVCAESLCGFVIFSVIQNLFK